MRVGIFELLVIVGLIVLLFRGKRLVKLLRSLRDSKEAFHEGLEEPIDAEFKEVPVKDNPR